MERNDAAIRAVSTPQNLSSFAERGFRTVDKNRVLASLTGPEIDPEAALDAARAAVEAVGGFVTSTERNAGLGGGREGWRYIYEVWMVPEDVSIFRAA
jgi:hypothetical protein